MRAYAAESVGDERRVAMLVRGVEQRQLGSGMRLFPATLSREGQMTKESSDDRLIRSSAQPGPDYFDSILGFGQASMTLIAWVNDSLRVVGHPGENGHRLAPRGPVASKLRQAALRCSNLGRK